MNIFPAIDIIDGKAVRLVKGDYGQMTVYSNSPLDVAKEFEACGAEYLHVVDLEGARDGNTPNFSAVEKIICGTGLKVEIGGGIRSIDTVGKYIDAGAYRVILGTAAITDPDFLESAVDRYKAEIAVGVDIKDGKVAVKGWTEVLNTDCFEFCKKLEKTGVNGIICTDISKDGLLGGTNIGLYEKLAAEFTMNITASGGITTIDDIRKLRTMKLFGAILGKALYTGNISLRDAVEVCKEQ